MAHEAATHAKPERSSSHAGLEKHQDNVPNSNNGQEIYTNHLVLIGSIFNYRTILIKGGF